MLATARPWLSHSKESRTQLGFPHGLQAPKHLLHLKVLITSKLELKQSQDLNLSTAVWDTGIKNSEHNAQAKAEVFWMIQRTGHQEKECGKSVCRKNATKLAKEYILLPHEQDLLKNFYFVIHLKDRVARREIWNWFDLPIDLFPS